MMPDSCARCGRTRPSEHLTAGDAPVITDSWAVLDGLVVCPDCQTADERREVEDRIIAAILNEIDRRQRGDVPPDEYEMALGAYAMALRALRPDPASGNDEPEGTRAPRSVSDEVDDDTVEVGHADTPTTQADACLPDNFDGSVMRVAITGAFLTGHPLPVHIENYAKVQAELGEILLRPQWTVEAHQKLDGTYQSGGGFTTAAPLVIARRDGADLLPWLTSALNAGDLMRTGRPRAARTVINATPLRFSIDFYDLGVGVLTAWIAVKITGGRDLGATAGELKRQVLLRGDGGGVPPLSQALQSLATAATQEYGRAASSVRANASAPSDDDPASAARLPLAGERGTDRARLLWLHPVHVITVEDSTARVVKALAPAFHERIAFDGGTFAAGIGWSAIAALPTSNSVATPIALTELHWAYYALYMEIDRELLHVLDQSRGTVSKSLKELESDSNAVFADYMWVINARARLDSALSARGGDELAIWQAIAKVQRFDAVVDSVDRKLEALDTLAKRRVDQANTYRARRTADALGYISLLTLVTVTIAVIGLLFGARNPGVNSWWLRVPAIVTAFLLSILVYWYIYIRTMRPRSKKKR
jgi:hypothetical protein